MQAATAEGVGSAAPPQVAKAVQADAQGELPPPPEGMVWVSGSVNDMPGGRRPAGVAEVCVHAPKSDQPCVTTTSAGHYRIAVPKRANVALLYRGEGLTPTLRAFVTGEGAQALGNTRVANAAGVTNVAKTLKVEHLADHGVIFFSGRPGTTASLEPPSGKRFFLDYKDSLVEGAESVPLRGSGGFLNVMPAPTAIRFSNPEGPCVFNADNWLSGWPDPADPGVAIVPVLPGHHTHTVTMYCGK